MSEEKVVSLHGGPVEELLKESAPEVVEMAEKLLRIVRGEPHVAIGFFVIDHMGRSLTNWHIESIGSNAVGAANILAYKVTKAYADRK